MDEAQPAAKRKGCCGDDQQGQKRLKSEKETRTDGLSGAERLSSEQNHLRGLVGAERREALAALLRESRDAREAAKVVEGSTALCRLLFRAVAALPPPRPSGDAGPSVSPQDTEDLRTVKRALIMCLEGLNFGLTETSNMCVVALAHVQALLDGVVFSKGAKGAQQWTHIRALVDAALLGQVLEREQGDRSESGPSQLSSGAGHTHLPLDGGRNHRRQIDEDCHGVPGVVVTLVRRVLVQLGEATAKEAIQVAWDDPGVWEGVTDAAMSSLPRMSWWSAKREPWESMLATSIRLVRSAVPITAVLSSYLLTSYGSWKPSMPRDFSFLLERAFSVYFPKHSDLYVLSPAFCITKLETSSRF